ncbi:MAG TPA: hypothetical protein VI937_00655 [Negativicutes bacterium]|nr:hypothetical protein [Negativicutes bacterium]
MEDIKKYIEENVDMANIAEPEKESIIDGLVKNISTAISIEVFKVLDEKGKKEFTALLESGQHEKLEGFIHANVKQLPVLVKQATDKTINEFNGLMEKSRI